MIFLALSLAWGIPYLLIKVAVGELTPGQLVLFRTALGAVLLMPLALARGAVQPVLRQWRPLLAYSLIEINISWLFLSRAEQVLPSSTTGLLIATVPLAGLGVAALSGHRESLGRSNLSGLLLGLLGVAALVGLDVSGSDLFGVLQVAVTVVGYAVGPAIMARRLSDLPGIGVVAVSLSIAAVVYAPYVALTGGLPSHLPSASVIISVVLLAVVCTVAAFLLLFALVAQIGPVRATTITYLNTAVAVAAGALVLHERITLWTMVGFVLVIAGSVLVNRGRGRGRGESAARPVTEPDASCLDAATAP